MDRKEVERLRRGEVKWTRRKALSFLMQIYDPLQILTPVLLEGKLLTRRLASPSFPWDEDVPAQEKI